MFRRDLIDILKERHISLHELALLLDEKPRVLENDLQHLFRSLRKDPLCPAIMPARCHKCGFRFDENKLHKPGKWPRCKGTWIMRNSAHRSKDIGFATVGNFHPDFLMSVFDCDRQNCSVVDPRKIRGESVRATSNHRYCTSTVKLAEYEAELGAPYLKESAFNLSATIEWDMLICDAIQRGLGRKRLLSGLRRLSYLFKLFTRMLI